MKLSQLKNIQPVYSMLLRFGLTPLGRSLRSRAFELGFKLVYRNDRIGLRKDGREVWFALTDAAHLWTIMPRMAYIQSRLVFENKRGRQSADVRGLRRYRVPETDDQLWMATMPEPANFVEGYFARGRPALGDVVFDCGSYCGEMTMLLSRIVGPTGRVYSFEPDGRSRERLSQNIEEAHLTNATVIDRGLWKETTTLRFMASADLVSRISESHEIGPSVEVPVLSLKDACEIAGEVPSFVKMDIEGAEIEAIEGSLDFIQQHSIRFAIASYHLRDGRPTSETLETLFQSIGYQVETGFPDHLTTWACKAR